MLAVLHLTHDAEIHKSVVSSCKVTLQQVCQFLQVLLLFAAITEMSIAIVHLGLKDKIYGLCFVQIYVVKLI